MGDSGLRVAEVLDVCPDHISRMSDGRHYVLEVVGGKDTSGSYSGGKHWETWLPVDLERDINRYVQSEEIARELRPARGVIGHVAGRPGDRRTGRSRVPRLPPCSLAHLDGVADFIEMYDIDVEARAHAYANEHAMEPPKTRDELKAMIASDA